MLHGQSIPRGYVVATRWSQPNSTGMSSARIVPPRSSQLNFNQVVGRCFGVMGCLPLGPRRKRHRNTASRHTTVAATLGRHAKPSNRHGTSIAVNLQCMLCAPAVGRSRTSLIDPIPIPSNPVGEVIAPTAAGDPISS